MSSEFYSDSERAEIADEYYTAIKNNTPISKDLADRMADANLGIKNFSSSLRDSKAILTRSIVDVAKKLNTGAQGAEMFIDAAKNGLITVGKYATKISNGAIPDMTAVIEPLAALPRATAQQSDTLYKANQQQTRAGLLGSGGMTELYNNMQDFGYNVNNLNEMTTLLANNSGVLAQFGDTASAGVKRIALMSKTMMDTPDLKREFLNMGMTVDQINAGSMAYINQLTILGVSQRRTDNDLYQGAVTYIREMDELSRVTGQTRDVMADQLKSATDIDTFAATLALAEKERSGGSKELQKTYTLLMGMDPSGNLARGMAESLNGFISDNEQAQQLYRMTNGKVLKWGQQLRRGEIDSYQYADKVAKAYAKSNDGINNMTQAGVDTAKYYGKAADRTLVAGEGMKDYIKIGEEAKAATEAAARGDDELTNKQSKMRELQLQNTKGVNNLLNNGVQPLTTGLSKLADSMKWATDLVGKKPTIGEGGTGTPQVQQATTQYPPTDALTGKSLDGVQPGLAKAVSMAAADYKSQTGKKTIVTSAFRSYQDQIRLYNDYITGKSPYPAGKPGHSKHESGLAVDVNRTDAEAMDQMGILGKYGLSRPVPHDPVHIEGGMKVGGIASGPISGYSQVLHGNEAVIPLSDSKKIPVTVLGKRKNGFITMKTVEMLQQRAERMDTMIRLLQDDITAHEKILAKHS